jgi:hypothetical protein
MNSTPERYVNFLEHDLPIFYKLVRALNKEKCAPYCADQVNLMSNDRSTKFVGINQFKYVRPAKNKPSRFKTFEHTVRE